MGLGDNLKAERKAAKLTQAALAEKAGVPQSIISEIESGKRQSTGALPEIAQAIGIPVARLDPRFGAPGEAIYKPPPVFMNERDTMPVYASAEGGDGAVIISTAEIDRVLRPYTLEGVTEAYAILITGESMIPAYEPGDYAWVNPRLPPMRDTDCVLYELNGETGEARATIKRLIKWTPTQWNLRQWNPRKDFSLDRAKWNRHHRVVGNFRRR